MYIYMYKCIYICIYMYIYVYVRLYILRHTKISFIRQSHMNMVVLSDKVPGCHICPQKVPGPKFENSKSILDTF